MQRYVCCLWRLKLMQWISLCSSTRCVNWNKLQAGLIILLLGQLYTTSQLLLVCCHLLSEVIYKQWAGNLTRAVLSKVSSDSGVDSWSASACVLTAPKSPWSNPAGSPSSKALAAGLDELMLMASVWVTWLCKPKAHLSPGTNPRVGRSPQARQTAPLCAVV